MAESTFLFCLMFSQEVAENVDSHQISVYLNCGEIYDFMIDHRSYRHNLSSCEFKLKPD